MTDKTTFQKIKSCLTLLLILIIGGYTALALTVPEQLAQIIGYRPYIIMTDSMKDTLPPGTLVIDRTITIENFHTLKPDDIITFKVDDLRANEIFTHYYKELQSTQDGLWVRTQSEILDRYDDYSTTPSDVLGTVVLAIPWIGRFILFWRSPFGLMELGILGIIWVINTLIWRRLDAAEHFSQKGLNLAKPLRLDDIHLRGGELRGVLLNPNPQACTGATMAVQVWYSGDKTQCLCQPMPEIPPKGRLKWHWPFEKSGNIVNYTVTITKEDKP
ncbi:S26 family signal peptidase [Eubacterium sp.]|uniref:S26 family signal peptidase n=1 Tax=Eubacterium sp. TaxID=142586 RepID=UPI002FC6F812